jgi:hypothetical protein
LKDNTKYEVQGDPVFEKKLEKDAFGVYKVEHIHIEYRETVEVEKEGKKKTKKVKKIKNTLFAAGILQRRTGQKIQVYHKQPGNIR